MSGTRLIEEAALNAWPALNSLLYDGWVLRFSDGYTKRANSVTPLYAADLESGAKIAFCENLYRRQGLRPIFRLAQVNAIAGLDEALAARGYAQMDVTSVQGRRVESSRPMPADAAVVGLDEWLAIFHRLHPTRGDSGTHEAILRRIMGAVCPMALFAEGDAVACGLAVLQGELLGLFDIVTAVRERRRGYGREVTEGLLAWGVEQGARSAYLQVMLSNDAARALYGQLGFEELYRYWYRAAGE